MQWVLTESKTVIFETTSEFDESAAIETGRKLIDEGNYDSKAIDLELIDKKGGN